MLVAPEAASDSSSPEEGRVFLILTLSLGLQALALELGRAFCFEIRFGPADLLAEEEGSRVTRLGGVERTGPELILAVEEAGNVGLGVIVAVALPESLRSGSASLLISRMF